MAPFSALDAFHTLATAYPGGIAALAHRFGKHPGTLRAELRPPQGSTAKLGWEDGLELMAMGQQVGLSCALAPLDAAELQFGRLFVASLPIVDGVNDEQLAMRVAACAKEFADVMQEVAKSAADGRISDNEYSRSLAQCTELITELQQLMTALRARNQASKPAHLRAAA